MVYISIKIHDVAVFVWGNLRRDFEFSEVTIAPSDVMMPSKEL